MLSLSTYPGKRLSFLFGLVVSLASGFLIDIVSAGGDNKAIVTTVILMGMTALMWVIYPERIKVNETSLYLLISGCALGIIIYFIRYYKTNVQFHEQNSLDLYVYAVSIGIVTPLFEELSLRRLMFFGASNVIGPWCSAILVSALFAWVHKGMFGFAFVVSLFLCFCAYRGVDTVNRAIFHGSYNIALTLLMLSAQIN
jgi:membrane protease YdiL (CAAX protease family)